MTTLGTIRLIILILLLIDALPRWGYSHRLGILPQRRGWAPAPDHHHFVAARLRLASPVQGSNGSDRDRVIQTASRSVAPPSPPSNAASAGAVELEAERSATRPYPTGSWGGEMSGNNHDRGYRRRSRGSAAVSLAHSPRRRRSSCGAVARRIAASVWIEFVARAHTRPHLCRGALSASMPRHDWRYHAYGAFSGSRTSWWLCP